VRVLFFVECVAKFDFLRARCVVTAFMLKAGARTGYRILHLFREVRTVQGEIPPMIPA
jgi:hypothetical protein